MPVQAPTRRERGQRAEHAPSDSQGNTEEPESERKDDETGHVNFAEDMDAGASYAKAGLAVKFEDREEDDDDDEDPEPRVIQGQTEQRHGCVEQRKGVSIRDDAGNVVSVSELWRCQCQAKFMGRTAKESKEMYEAHIRKFDPAVPPPKPERRRR